MRARARARARERARAGVRGTRPPSRAALAVRPARAAPRLAAGDAGRSPPPCAGGRTHHTDARTPLCPPPRLPFACPAPKGGGSTSRRRARRTSSTTTPRRRAGRTHRTRLRGRTAARAGRTTGASRALHSGGSRCSALPESASPKRSVRALVCCCEAASAPSATPGPAVWGCRLRSKSDAPATPALSGNKTPSVDLFILTLAGCAQTFDFRPPPFPPLTASRNVR